MFQTREAVSYSQMFFKNRCFQNFRKFHKKSYVLESLFNKVARLERSATLLKSDSSKVVFLCNWRKRLCTWLLLKSRKYSFSVLFVMIIFLSETCDFPNNANFICFKSRLKKKHSPAICVICTTKIHWIEIHL